VAEEDVAVKDANVAEQQEPSSAAGPDKESAFMDKASGLANIASGQDNDKAEMEAFFNSERNYIILTNTGKPVFAAHGDIYTLSSIYATLYAMISKAQTYEFTQGPNVEDELESQELGPTAPYVP